MKYGARNATSTPWGPNFRDTLGRRAMASLYERHRTVIEVVLRKSKEGRPAARARRRRLSGRHDVRLSRLRPASSDTDGAVDPLAEEVGVAVVPGVLMDHVQHH